ncbi:phospholipase [Pedobacter yulinensis]|uniref:Phospholipase n=1 Tax=Pedobacter yulinensis TaxID=2126353 RepID=A0A2T3HS31_9SPHI|nr:prolyl oligopeptidase family serine peptidase [Pedobacter yulinensis]PST85248.1 phospholipase [Pedobacter yulinensis]
MKKRLTFLLFAFLLCFTGLHAQNLENYQRGEYLRRNDTIPYRILWPRNFDPKKKYPLVFVLHGRGESGSDNEKQLTHGARLFLRDDVRKKYPAIVIFPQCSQNSYWSNVAITTNAKGKRSFSFQQDGKPTGAMRGLLGLVKQFTRKPYVARKQVYVGGLSMGGMGTYELLRRKRHTFAAAFAICGGDNTRNAERYKHVPLWIFHGAKDDIVDPAYSIAIADRLKALNAEVKFTLYPQANHGSWEPAFAEPNLLLWLFSHTKP